MIGPCRLIGSDVLLSVSWGACLRISVGSMKTRLSGYNGKMASPGLCNQGCQELESAQFHQIRALALVFISYSLKGVLDW